MLILEDLSDVQRARVIERLKSRGPEFNCFPLSSNQRRLWFFAKLHPETGLYNIPTALRLEGPLNDAALSLAIDALVARHESLRCQFLDLDGDPAQLVLEPRAGVLDARDVTGGTASQRWDSAVAEARLACMRPFRIERGEVFRATLWRVSPTLHLLVLNLHHIVSDAWSVAIMIRDLRALYESARTGTATDAALPPMQVQYADYALWERDQAADHHAHTAYWLDRLQGEWSATTVMPCGGRSGPAHAGDTVALHIPAEETVAFRLLCSREGVTLQAGLLAAFKLLLHLYSGEKDIVIGSPVNVRHRAELEPVIGFFINTVVLRTRLDAGLCARDLLSRSAETLLGALSHAALPYDEVVEAVASKDPGRGREFFHVMFAAQPLASAMQAEMAGVSVRQEALNSGTAKVDLALFIGETDTGVAGTLEYTTARYDSDFIAQMLAHYRALIGWMVRCPDADVSRAQYLSPAEHEALSRWGAASQAHDSDAPALLDRFLSTAARKPDAIAVSAPDGQWTYAELVGAASCVQHRLQAAGVRRESRVAVAVGRSRAMVAAVLGVLGAGAAYVPIDAQTSSERHHRILQDCRADVLLTDGSLSTSTWAEQACLLIDDALLPDAPGGMHGGRWAPKQRHPEQAAYVIYTSGSTGQPKGVLVPDRGLDALVSAQIAAFDIGASSCVLQFASLGFDASVSELFTALIAGATLAIPTDAQRANPDALAVFLASEAVTHATLPPSLLAILHDDALRGVRVLVSAGEPLPLPVSRRWAADHRLINAYGPTETTVCLTCGIQSPAQSAVTVGTPLPHVSLAILDAQFQPVPAGVPGLLYAGGSSLARGYLGQPAITAERFIPDPHAKQPGARLYCTGDLARWRPDGEVEILGRIDGQIKLRGVRIEPGEIEAAIRAFPHVHDAAVVLKGAGVEAALVAFVVPETAAEPLHEVLAQQLPDAMRPQFIVGVDALPLNASGKVDRRALLAAHASLHAESAPHDLPSNALERTLAAAWSEVLGVPSPGMSDHFFRSGGHSLLAIKLCRLVELRAGTAIPLQRFLQNPQLRFLADHCKRVADRDSGMGESAIEPFSQSCIEVLKRGTGAPPMVLVPALLGDLHSYQPMVERLGTGRPVLGLSHKAQHRDAGSLVEFAACWLDEVLQLDAPLSLCGWSFGAVVAIELARACAKAGRPVEHLLLIEPSLTGDRGVQTAAFHPDVLRAMPDLMARSAHERALLAAYRLRAVEAARVSLVVAAPAGTTMDAWVLKSAWLPWVHGELNVQVVEGSDHHSVLQQPHLASWLQRCTWMHAPHAGAQTPEVMS